jgi:hypothetical protein
LLALWAAVRAAVQDAAKGIDEISTGPMSEPSEAVISEFVHETYSNDAPTGATENPDAVSILLDQTVLQKFVGESGLVYYKCAFEKLIDAYGIRNSKLSDVDDKQLRQIAFRRGAKERWKARLPFVKDTTWNWSAFLFGIFWAVWRGIAYKWWILAVWVVGVSINGGSFVLPSLAVAIFLERAVIRFSSVKCSGN